MSGTIALAAACHVPRLQDPPAAAPAGDRGVALAAAAAAAEGGAQAEPGISHRAGANVGVVRAHYGVPILQKAFYWDGNGEEDNYGVGLYGLRFVNDGVALGMGSNATVWMQRPGHDVYSIDAESVLHWYPVESVRPFVDIGGGFVYATDQVPEGGTHFTYTFHFGFGYDFPVGPGTSLLAGLQFHHISNALGRQNDRNPSQNEGRFWIGYAWNF